MEGKMGVGGGGRGEAKISVVEKPETRRKGPNRVGRHGTRTNTRAFYIYILFETIPHGKRDHGHISLSSSALSHLKDLRRHCLLLLLFHDSNCPNQQPCHCSRDTYEFLLTFSSGYSNGRSKEIYFQAPNLPTTDSLQKYSLIVSTLLKCGFFHMDGQRLL